jgi:hypothetical protein
MLHRGERVVPAADNWSNQGRYTRLDAPGAADSGGTVHLNFSKNAIQLVVPPERHGHGHGQHCQPVRGLPSKPQILAKVRSN